MVGVGQGSQNDDAGGDRVCQLVRGKVPGHVQPLSGATPYVLLGDNVVVLLLVGLLALALALALGLRGRVSAR